MHAFSPWAIRGQDIYIANSEAPVIPDCSRSPGHKDAAASIFQTPSPPGKLTSLACALRGDYNQQGREGVRCQAVPFGWPDHLPTYFFTRALGVRQAPLLEYLNLEDKGSLIHPC